MAFEKARFYVSLEKEKVNSKSFYREEVERKESFENYFPAPAAVASGWML